MKTGILTFHNAPNYGAVLQAFASVRLLQSMGHEAFVLDYRNGAVSSSGSPYYWDRGRFKKEGLRYLLKYPLLVTARLKRTRAFNRFIRQRLPLCPCSEASGLDLLLVGSDQVWNKQITGGRDPFYFGERFPQVRKVAWAASAGKTVPDKDDIELISRNFAAVSVRECSLSEQIPGNTLLSDPTLMLSAVQWRELVHHVGGKYLLAYPMLFEEEVMATARSKARELNLELKVLSPSVRLGSASIQAASPEDFLSLIDSASYVVTSSFHGAVFSLLFERPHTFVYHDDPRFDTLLSADIPGMAARAKEFLAGVAPLSLDTL